MYNVAIAMKGKFLIFKTLASSKFVHLSLARDAPSNKLLN